MSKCFLVDGLNLIFRCFYGIPLLNNQNFPTNAILGSVKILSKIINLEESAHIAIFFDKGRDPNRQSLFPEYKANRVEMPDPVKVQIPVIKEFAYALGCTVIERSGIEADDLIASFAYKYGPQFDEILIFSTDKDFAQCVGDNVYQIIPGNDRDSIGNCLDREGIWEKFGVYPEQMVDYLALIGDQADNIPGIRGVGPKTASIWLGEFGNVEAILSQTSLIKPVRFRSILKESAEILQRNRRLIALNRAMDNIYLEKNVPDEQAYDQLIEMYQLVSLKRKRRESQWVQDNLFL
ncbi:MAG: 5'-3' exonuclease [Puniceicoccales bacterium]|jgi:DNA polymerase-1|nr:5'-3' exonuclease [Puniceicoccales bacterium]